MRIECRIGGICGERGISARELAQRLAWWLMRPESAAHHTGAAGGRVPDAWGRSV